MVALCHAVVLLCTAATIGAPAAFASTGSAGAAPWWQTQYVEDVAHRMPLVTSPRSSWSGGGSGFTALPAALASAPHQVLLANSAPGDAAHADPTAQHGNAPLDGRLTSDSPPSPPQDAISPGGAGAQWAVLLANSSLWIARMPTGAGTSYAPGTGRDGRPAVVEGVKGAAPVTPPGTLPPYNISMARLDARLGSAVSAAIADGSGARSSIASVRGGSDAVRVLVTPSMTFSLDCPVPRVSISAEAAAAACSVRQSWPTPAELGAANATAMGPAGEVVWVVGAGGLFHVDLSTGRYTSVVSGDEDATLAAVAVNPQPPAADGTYMVAAGGAQKLYLVEGKSAVILRWEWVARLRGPHTCDDSLGGVIDAAITSLTFDSCGALWCSGASAASVMFANGTFVRLAGLQGLPYGNITSVVADDGHGGDVWLGTTAGLARFSPGADGLRHAADRSGLCIGELAGLPRPGDWRWFAGARWLPDDGVVALSSSNGVLLAATQLGMARIAHEQWTLEQKAAHYAAMVPRHDRDKGWTADCGLAGPGNVSSIACHPGESDGLWTGIMAAADGWRVATLGGVDAPEDARSALRRRVQALEALSVVTDIPGYPARTAALADEPGADGRWWHNSTAAAYAGWAWMGNTSSDEIAGHMLGLPVVLEAAGNATGQQALVTARIAVMVTNIVRNGYVLFGYGGLRTRWGVWSPQYTNGARDWSDQRGLNSLQMLSFLASAVKAAGGPSNAPAVLLEAEAELQNATNQYNLNMQNQKIEAPSDDNYSDDELAFLPLFPLLRAQPTNPDALACRSRTFGYVRRERNPLWAAMYLATTPTGESMDADAANDVVWALQQWPLEQIAWDTENSVRSDVRFNPNVNRDQQHWTQSVRVLPGRERSQFRWNADPFALDAGDGGGVEFDPGAWLAPYWLARWAELPL